MYAAGELSKTSTSSSSADATPAPAPLAVGSVGASSSSSGGGLQLSQLQLSQLQLSQLQELHMHQQQHLLQQHRLLPGSALAAAAAAGRSSVPYQIQQQLMQQQLMQQQLMQQQQQQQQQLMQQQQLQQRHDTSASMAYAAPAGGIDLAQEAAEARHQLAQSRLARPGPKQPWLPDELDRLRSALALHGRNWIAVQEYVGTKSRRQCESKVLTEVSAGRMLPPQGKQVQLPWTKLETAILRLSVARHGRDWQAVAADVGTKTKQQCENKVTHEVSAGRMREPPRKQEHRSWTTVEVQRLHAAVLKHGRNWVAVSKEVGTKTNQQCQDKLTSEVSKGRMTEPGGPRKRFAWTRAETRKLRKAIVRFGRDWVAIARHVGSKDRQQCMDKVRIEVAAGRLAKDPFDTTTQEPVSDEESDDDQDDGAAQADGTGGGGAGSSNEEEEGSETEFDSARPSTLTQRPSTLTQRSASDT